MDVLKKVWREEQIANEKADETSVLKVVSVLFFFLPDSLSLSPAGGSLRAGFL